MNCTRRIFTAGLALSGVLGLDTAMAQGKSEGKGQGNDKGKGKGKGKANHHDGAKLIGAKIKTKGKHVIDKRGPDTVSLDVTDGKIAGMHVKHDTKGELQVKKYKTKKKMAQADSGFHYASFIQVQNTYLGTTYIGYSYYDDYGDEYIYWFPYDMILNGDTGAVEYLAA
ncbi:MAG: hypothetical protein ABIW85_06375 [Variovorax sp.]